MHVTVTIEELHALVKEKYRIHNDFTVAVEPTAENPRYKQCEDNNVWFPVPSNWRKMICPHFEEWGVVHIKVITRGGQYETGDIDSFKEAWVQSGNYWDVVAYRKA